MKDIVEKIKAAVRIEQIIEQDGYHLQDHGTSRKGIEHDSLVVYISTQSFYWYSTKEHGDVINWVQYRRGLDFKDACDELCRRANLPLPEWGHEDAQVRIAARAKEDAFDVAVKVFQDWLERDPKALEFSAGRGWSEATAQAAKIGYSGHGTEKERKELEGELSLAGVDLKSPPVMALFNLLKHEDSVNSIVYPHYRGGRVKYLSTRGVGEKRHYNLLKDLVGDRQPYCNWRYSSGADEVVIVEGQADAITLGQWGYAAVALAGTSMNDAFVEMIIGRKKGIKRKEGDKEVLIYVGLDADKAGNASAWQHASEFGPMVRLIHWPEDEGKDANDLLKRLIKGGEDADQQAKAIAIILENSRTFVEEICTWAGRQKGAERDEALKKAFEVVVQMPEFERATYQADLSKAMDINQREFGRIVKTMLNESKKIERSGDTTFTLGGVIDGWVVEYLYDPEDHTPSLAWRDPEGKLGSGRTVEIGHVVYEAAPATETFEMGGVLFPSKIGEPKPTGEIVKYVEAFIKRNYLIAQDLDGKIMSYYVLLTWLYDSFNAIPYLRVMGEAGSGKSELMRRIGLICYRTISSNGCGTPATLFRMVEKYRGTVFIDEADLGVSDTTSEVVKFLNLGAMKGNPITRLDETRDEDGKKGYEERMYRTYCPKLIAMRKDYKDDAVGSRCLTFKIQPRETFELIKYHVPLEINNDMRASALAMRNLLLRWKLDHWQLEIPIDPTFYDLDISSRLNQVTGALMAISKDAPELQKEMRQFLREYYSEMTQVRSMMLEARVIEAIWQIHRFPDLRAMYVVIDKDGVEKMLVGSVTTIANQIMDTMNFGDEKEDEHKHKKDEDDDDSKKSKPKDSLKPQKIGRMLREDLQIKIAERTRLGFYMVWDEDRMTALAKRYGLNLQEIGPTDNNTHFFNTASKPMGQKPIHDTDQKLVAAEPTPTQNELPIEGV
jgi:hypothetical protein